MYLLNFEARAFFGGRSAHVHRLSFECTCIGSMADFVCTVEAVAANKAVFLSTAQRLERQNFESSSF